MSNGASLGNVAPQATRRTMDFSLNVDADSSNQLGIDAPFSGYVVDPFLSFPAGTKETLGFKLVDFERSQQIIPYNTDKDYLFFDGVQDAFPTSFPVEEGDEIRVEMLNQHQSTPRFMPVTVHIISDRFFEYKAKHDLEGLSPDEVLG